MTSKRKNELLGHVGIQPVTLDPKTRKVLEERVAATGWDKSPVDVALAERQLHDVLTTNGSTDHSALATALSEYCDRTGQKMP